MMLHICIYGYFYVQNLWASNIADAVFADPPVSQYFLYMQHSDICNKVGTKNQTS